MHEWVLAFLFIDNSNRRIYSELVKKLANNYLVGQDKYPMDMATAQKLLVNYKPMGKSSGVTSDGITFVTGGRPRTQKEKSNITCFRCRVSGHYSTKNACKQEEIDKYNATIKVN